MHAFGGPLVLSGVLTGVGAGVYGAAAEDVETGVVAGLVGLAVVDLVVGILLINAGDSAFDLASGLAPSSPEAPAGATVTSTPSSTDPAGAGPDNTAPEGSSCCLVCDRRAGLRPCGDQCLHASEACAVPKGCAC